MGTAVLCTEALTLPKMRELPWMGDECEKFLKNLAELLAKEDGEYYTITVMS